jgi:Ni,Fe-hydrogenase III large subunit
VEGREVHEVAVGPVHAGIIEPGHFRFQCHGENVFHLEIELGYQHRGVERALVGGPNARTAHLMETLAGDTTIGHATAYASVMEGFGGTTAPPRARSIRAIALELERLANHTGDLGALANDVGFLPTASYCGRLRGDYLNMTALLCGNRFGRNLIRPGGVRIDMTAQTIDDLLDRLRCTFDDTRNAVNLLWETPSVMSRFDGTGCVSRQDAARLGLVGPAGRASGIEFDVRSDLPWGAYQSHPLPSMTWNTGDVAARAYVRWFEIEKSMEFIADEARALPAGSIQEETAAPTGESLAVALVEGWRGEICHTAVTDAQGGLRHYKIVDPSFHNWFGLAMALRNQQISDFPLCNKSFNLSYCGHDL